MSLGLPVNDPERRRPRFHFTAERNWLNDPNGLVYAGGEYHLFYQHHPAGLRWGPMHWGHAVSADLIHWQHRPIALYPDERGAIFSGSAVVDAADTAGFGAGALVAVFTHDQDGAQRQSLAYSRDQGRTWTKYAGNPVLAGRPDQPDFRDPKVFWHDDHWVMLLAAKDRILFYTSPNLKDWTPSSRFGPGPGLPAGVWETPELRRLLIDSGPAARWVLFVGVQQGAPAGGSGTRYFVGDFDGYAFTADNPPDTVLWADYGADFYAAQAWNDAPAGRAVIIAWMNNWDYANQVPATLWRGVFSLPRELALTAAPDGPRLVQRPLLELRRRRGPGQTWRQVRLAPADPLCVVGGAAVELLAEFQAEPAGASFGIHLRTEAGDCTTIRYVPAARQLTVDRTRSGAVDFGPGFGAAHTAPLAPVPEAVRLHVFVDTQSVEVFANDGQVTVTDQIFPVGEHLTVEIFAEGGAVTVTALELYPLTAAW